MAGLIDKTLERNDLDPETRGIIKGYLQYAYMNNGVYYVGTTGTTLDTAITKCLEERGYERNRDR